jgi:predicted Zn-dependent peptidase
VNRLLSVFLLYGVSVLPGYTQDFAELEGRLSTFALANGLRVVVLERHNAPQITCVTHVGAGSANDPAGATGLAHFFEHLAFKGSETLGSTDPVAEKKALDAAEEAYDRLEAERAKGRQANDVKVLTLELEMRKALSAAQKYVVPDELVRVFGENGASGLSSGVNADYSQFQVTIPASRAELWFLLESQRLTRPVFRDFYRDRDDSVGPFRDSVELNPQLRILQTLVSAAFTAHPYRNPTIGYGSDFAGLRMSEARQFASRYYVPSNMLMAIVGDIQPEEAKRLAEKYFGPMPARPAAPPVRTREPGQTGPRTVVIENAAESMVAFGFKRPNEFDREDPVLDVMQSLLGEGRSSLLYQELTETRRIASTSRVLASYPGALSPHLFAITATTAPGHTAEETEKAVLQVLARLQSTPVDEDALRRARSQARASLVRRRAAHDSLAPLLASHAFDFGDGRRLFALAGQYQKVTAAHIQAAAIQYFGSAGRTTVLMVPPAPVSTGAAKGDSK